MAIAKSERLTVLSDAEQEALYGLPDFDDAQRLEYLALTENELALASSRPSIGRHSLIATLESPHFDSGQDAWSGSRSGDAIGPR